MPNSNTNQKAPLNQILYGPPGTGKTYQTIDRALEILLEYKEIESVPENREKKKKIFDEFKEKGQIKFVTFHQSYSYEEFVEGIKPVVGNNGEFNNKKDNGITYEISSGIFKKLCNNALLIYQGSEISSQNYNKIIDKNKEFWRLYTVPESQEDYFDECIKNEHVWAYSGYGGVDIEKRVQEGDYVIIPDGSKKVRAFGIFKEFDKKESTASKDDKYKERVYRKVKWLWQKTERQDGYVLEGIHFGIPTFQKIVKYKDRILQHINLIVSHKNKPYILIIDEINRGNISKILGELITLIEPSKRIGAVEELRITLPYSQKSFGVPKNLYIIGTMNTADRSIALLDTALRRRFEFIEMMPDCEELKKIWLIKASYAERDNTNHLSKKELYLDDYKADKSEILCNILEAINRRIEFLLDREHTIGHAFFFERAKYHKNDRVDWYELSVEDLKNIFAKKVIPLLQEYFYDDYAKIDVVLNGNGMIESKSRQDLGITIGDEFIDSEKRICEITNSSTWDINSFLKIYSEKTRFY